MNINEKKETYMDNDVRFIDMRQFLRYLKSKFVIVLLVSIIGGAALAGYSYKKQKDDKETVAVDLLELTMQQNHDAYYIKNTKYSDAVPYTGVYNSAARLYVDFNYSDIENNENTDLSGMNSNYETDACQIVRDFDILSQIIAELDLKSYSDMKNINPEKIQWLINRNFQGAHMMNIVVSDVNPERAQAICKKIVDKFIEKADKLGFIDSVTIINNASLPESDGLYGTSIALANTKTVNKKTVIINGVLGIIGGFIVYTVIMLVVYIIRAVVRNEADMRTVGIDMVTGSYRSKADNARTARAFDLYDVKDILVVAIDRHIKAETFVNDVQGELKKMGSEKRLSFAEDFAGSNDAFEKVKKCDAVVYLTKYNKTRISDVIEARQVLEKSGIRCLGGIIL